MSPAELCRRNGWGPGTRLAGDEGYGPTTIEITAVGRHSILAVVEGFTIEQSWSLDQREWRVVSAPTPDHEDIRRAALLEAAKAIRDEDWWTDEPTATDYQAGDNDGKLRCIELIEARAGVGGVPAEPQPEYNACCAHCGCAEGQREGHDDLCAHGCNDDLYREVGAVPQDRKAGVPEEQQQ